MDRGTNYLSLFLHWNEATWKHLLPGRKSTRILLRYHDGQSDTHTASRYRTCRGLISLPIRRSSPPHFPRGLFFLPRLLFDCIMTCVQNRCCKHGGWKIPISLIAVLWPSVRFNLYFYINQLAVSINIPILPSLHSIYAGVRCKVPSPRIFT